MKRPSSGFLTRKQALDLYFVEARHKLIELGAFMDRVERGAGGEDFRMKAFRAAVVELTRRRPHKARRVLLKFSDPTRRPIAQAPGKGACGAWPGAK